MYILRGLPGSGKTTWARMWIAKVDYLRKRISKDDLRMMLDDSRYHYRNEMFIVEAQHALIRAAVQNIRDVVVDDTNINTDKLSDLLILAEELRITPRIIDFDIPVDVCIQRDSLRATPVGAARIQEMSKQLKEARKIIPMNRYSAIRYQKAEE